MLLSPLLPYFGPQVLPAAGAFFDGPAIPNLDHFTNLDFLVTYTSPDALGSAKFRLNWLDAVPDQFLDLRRDTVTPNQLVIDEVIGLIGVASRYVLRVTNPGGLDGLILSVGENGAILTPGTVTIQFAANDS